MYNLKEKSIIITGGGSGMGREASLLAARAGAHVTIADVAVEGGEETLRMVRSEGNMGQFIRTDITAETQVQAMVAKAMSAYGRIDGAFNNAGVPQISKNLHELTLAQFRRTIEINLVGTFLCMKYEIAEMLKTGGGAIVNTSSTLGVTALPAAAEYISSKHAVVGLTKAGAVDYATRGIRVNCVLPGVTATPMLASAIANEPSLEKFFAGQQPIGRSGLPMEIATAAVWLLSDHASFVTGASLAVDGGYTTI